MATTTNTEREFDFAALWAQHQRTFLGSLAAVAVLTAGAWFWTASRNLKETRAEVAFGSAEQTFYSGNFQLAATELERVLARYDGTRAGVRASMLLARTRFAEDKHAEGVALLREIVGTGAAKAQRAAIHALIAAGLENQRLFGEAATAFAQAAASATTGFDRDMYEADQARALASAGQTTQALEIWRRHAERESAPTANEARLRMGELAAKSAGS